LQNKLARLLPGGRSTTMTLGEWVEEYLDTHQGERVTVAKLRWLLGKATAELGEVRLEELSPEQVCALRLTVPEGHHFEPTLRLREPQHYPLAPGCRHRSVADQLDSDRSSASRPAGGASEEALSA